MGKRIGQTEKMTRKIFGHEMMGEPEMMGPFRAIASETWDEIAPNETQPSQKRKSERADHQD